MLERRRLAAVIIVGTFMGALLAGLIVSRESPEAYDTRIMYQVTEGMIERGDLRVTDDEFGFNTPYASYGLGMSVLFAAAYVIAEQTDGDPTSAIMMTNAFAFAVTAVGLLVLGRAMGLTARQAVAVMAATSTGTLLFSYVATGFSELPLAGAVTFGLASIGAARQNRAWAGWMAGAAVGAAVLLRTDSLVLVAPIVALGVVLNSHRRMRTIWQFAGAAAPFLVVWAWYNNLRFGSPLTLGYAGTDGFDGNFTQGLYGLTFAPGRGVVWYVPIIVVAAAGIRAAWRRDRTLTAAAAALFGGRLLLFAAWSSWWGGVSFGPRFLVPAMPALAVLLAGSAIRFRTWWPPVRVLVLAVGALSIAVQVVGATVGYEYHWNRFHGEAEAAGDPNAYLFDWKYFPIRGQAGWMVSQPDFIVGRVLPPARRPGLFVGMSSVVLWGAAAAWYGARRLDRTPLAPGGDDPPGPTAAVGRGGRSGPVAPTPPTGTRIGLIPARARCQSRLGRYRPSTRWVGWRRRRRRPSVRRHFRTRSSASTSTATVSPSV